MHTVVSVLVLVAVLAFAVVRPRGLPEVVAAVPGALVVLAAGLVSWHGAARELAALGPTVGFLAAVLVLARPDTAEAVTGARAGLLGRGAAQLDSAVDGVLAGAQHDLLHEAGAALGRPARLEGRRGRVEREVVAACAGTDLLVLARDGDHTRLGPRSLGHATRFVVDHAPCRVLLVWPDDPPALSTLPPPPPGAGQL